MELLQQNYECVSQEQVGELVSFIQEQFNIILTKYKNAFAEWNVDNLLNLKSRLEYLTERLSTQRDMNTLLEIENLLLEILDKCQWADVVEVPARPKKGIILTREKLLRIGISPAKIDEIVENLKG